MDKYLISSESGINNMNIDYLIDKYDFAIKLIGANILLYNHFDVYSIPINGNGFSDEKAKEDTENYLKCIESYYLDKNSINYDYGNDLKYQYQVKKFVMMHVKRKEEDTLCQGVKWLRSNYNL